LETELGPDLLSPPRSRNDDSWFFLHVQSQSLAQPSPQSRADHAL
jgi:hypothetical protein